ncbi:MAG: tetratricopeptide repeat protein [bacterium]
MRAFFKNLARRSWFPHFIILFSLLVLIQHFQGANISHFNLDDYKLILNNPSLKSLDGIGNVLASGRPVRGLTFMLDYQLFKLDPMGYHLSNLLWHWLGTCLLYLLVFRIFTSVRVAGVCAFLFFLHPVHTEAVMSVAHRKEMLAFVFLLLAYHAFLYRKRYPVLSVIFAVLFFLLGIGSKQVVLVFPLLLLVHLWLHPEEKPNWKSLLYVAPFLVAGALLLGFGMALSAPFLRDFDLFGRIPLGDFKQFSYPRILATSMSAYPLHFRYMLFPAHFNVVHELSLVGWDSVMAWAGVVMFGGLAAAVYFYRSRFLAAFSLAWMFINLLPIMNFIPANFFFAERYLYIPSAGFCLIAAGAVDRLFRHPGKFFPGRVYNLVLFFLLFVLMAILLVGPMSHRFTALWPPVLDYQTTPWFAILVSGLGLALGAALLLELVKRSSLEKLLERRWPVELVFTYVFIAFFLVAMILCLEGLVQGRFGLPQKDMDRALRLANAWMEKHAAGGPRSDQSRIYLSGSAAAEIYNFFIFIVGGTALILFAFRRLGRRYYKEHPNRALAVCGAGLIFLSFTAANSARITDWGSELRLWSLAVKEEPDSALAWNNLAKARFDRKKYGRAAKAYREVIRLEPDKAAHYRNLGIALQKEGKPDQAARAFKKALERRSGDITSRKNLANIYVTRALEGKDPQGFRKAVSHYLRILKLNPRSAHAHYNLAFCYYRMDDLDKAMRHVMKSLRIHPADEYAIKLRQQIINAMRQK